MQSSDCRKYAEQRMQLAPDLPPEHRKLVLDMADKWLQAAARLSVLENQTSKTQAQSK